MARGRTLVNLRADAYKRSDNEGTDGVGGRHPSADVTRYLNQGGAELWDLLIEARGPEYFQADPPASIATLASTTSYDLPAAFYMLIGVRLNGDFGFPLVPYDSQEESLLRVSTTNVVGYPSHYQLRRTTAGLSKLAVLPSHRSGETLVVDYVPAYVDLVADADVFDGINGWEEYVVCFAARCMAVKDEEWQLASALDADMAKLKQRILKLAPRRNMHRARRVKDVRGWR